MPNSNFTNSNTSAVFLNLTFSVTTETGSRIVNITQLNISLGNGSTTGNVYLSEDRGETWQCLGNNFPPVYSVRFG